MKFIQKAVIKKDNKFLVLSRSSDASYFPEHWDFPGGKLEPREDPKKGVEREVMEETALRVKVKDVLGIYEMDLEKEGKSLPHNFTVYSTELLGGKVIISKEHTDFKWATKKEILGLKTEPYVKLFFEENS
ncbi:MAG: NUDIX hydrolase [Nanoarchaeota archaeon]|nr:NUDIX hydrolase [Nanoarchaeota archaeon]